MSANTALQVERPLGAYLGHFEMGTRFLVGSFREILMIIVLPASTTVSSSVFLILTFADSLFIFRVYSRRRR